MAESDVATRVGDAIARDREAFDRRAREEGEALLSAVQDGVFDNPQAIVGLEYEFYGATTFDADGAGVAPASLRRMPRQLLSLIGFEKEIGLHNAEMSTSPQPLNRYGAGQPARRGPRPAPRRPRSNPPGGHPARERRALDRRAGRRVRPRLPARPRRRRRRRGRHERQRRRPLPRVRELGVRPPDGAGRAPRLAGGGVAGPGEPHHVDPAALPGAGGGRPPRAVPVRAPGGGAAAGARRELPLFPPELYDDDADPGAILERGRDEERIHVFESTLNPRDGPRKVRFPRDVGTVAEAVDHLVEDPTAVPMAVGDRGRYDDRFAHLRHKHGTFWRWIRPVFEGATPAAANARIEFRPLPAQPTVRDAIGFQAAFAGLMESLPRREHPLAGLAWEAARENFYAAARDGLDAEIEWVTADGALTTHPVTIYGAVFEYARDGLELRGLSRTEAESYLRPLRARFRHETTPAGWKRQRVREHLDDGEDFPAAVRGMQRTYVRRQFETLLGGSFADWLRG